MTSFPEGEIAPLQPLVSWVKQRYRASWQLRAQVLKLIRVYQGTPADPRPFVGRTALLKQLDAWLAQPAERLLLVTGAAGRGKTALLLHWLESAIQRDPAICVLYAPISIRFNTADERAGVQLLFTALSDVFGELQEGFPKQPEHSDYLAGISAAWQLLAARTGQAFLLVVDGLDEVSHRWFQDRRILPADLPPNLHVLIATRHKTGQASGTMWPEDLGTSYPAAVKEIDRVDRDAMAEAMRRLSPPLDQLAGQAATLEALYRLTDGGDPLLLTLWLGQIGRSHSGLSVLDAQGLAALQPSFEGFYDLWMQDQASLWQESGFHIQPGNFEQVLQILALAQGPLQLPDLLDVLQMLDPASPWDRHSLPAAMITAGRLVVTEGEGQSYVLVHPRLAHYFQGQLEAVPARLRAVKDAFRDWGVRTVQRINSGELPPEACPAYLLIHHVATHIDTGGEPAADTVEQHLLPLLQAGWARAWHAHSGDWQGYLQDLARITARLQAFNRVRVQEGRHEELRLAPELRAALLAATVRSMGSSLPLELIAGVVRAGIWSLPRGVRAARECPDATACLAELAAVAEKRGDSTLAQQLAEEALAACEQIQSALTRGTVLKAVVSRLGTNSAWLLRAARIAISLKDGHMYDSEVRAGIFVAIASRVEGPGRDIVLRSILEVIDSVTDEHRWRVLLAVAGRLQDKARNSLLRKAFEAATRSYDPSGIRAVAVQAAGEDRELLLQALMAESLAGEAPLLREVAPRMRGDRGWLEHALDRAEQLSGEGSAADVPWLPLAERVAGMLCALAPQMEGDPALLQRALDVARSLSDPVERASAVIAVAEAMGAGTGTSIRKDALKEVCEGRRIDRVPLLAALGRQLQSDHNDPALRAAWEESLTHGSFDRLIELAAVLAGPYGEQVLQHALRKACRHNLEHQLTAARRLEGARREAAVQRYLEVIGESTDYDRWHGQHTRECERLRMLPFIAALRQGESRREVVRDILRTPSTVLAGLTNDERLRLLDRSAWLAGGDAPLLQEALALAAYLRDGPARERALAATVEILGRDRARLPQAYALAQSLRGPAARASALAAVARHLPAETGHAVFAEALDAVAAEHNPSERLQAHAKVVAGLRGHDALLSRALDIASALPERDMAEHAIRVLALCAVARQQQGEARFHVLRQAVETAGTMNLNRLRTEDIAVLADACRGEPGLLARLREVADALEPGPGSLKVRCATARDLPGAAKLHLLRQAVEASVKMGVFWAHDLGLDALLEGLTDERALVQPVLEVAAGAPDQKARVKLLCDWAPLLPGQAGYALLEQAVEAAACGPSAALSTLAQSIARLAPGHALRQCARDLAQRRWAGSLPRELRTSLATPSLPERDQAQPSEAPQTSSATSGMNPANRALLYCAMNAVDENIPVGTMIDLLQLDATMQQMVAAAPAGEDANLPFLPAIDDKNQSDLMHRCLRTALSFPVRSSERVHWSLVMVQDCPGAPTYELWSGLLAQSRLGRREILLQTPRLVACAVPLTGSLDEAYRMVSVVQEVCTEWP